MKRCKKKGTICKEGGGFCWPLSASVTKVGDEPELLCLGHSDLFVDRMYEAMVKAEKMLDMSSLDIPNERFLAFFNAAMLFLDSKKKPIMIRFFSGPPLGAKFLSSTGDFMWTGDKHVTPL